MRNMFREFIRLLALMISVIGCADTTPRTLGLLDSPSEPGSLDDERRRLQSLQLVRYTDANGDAYFMPTRALDDILREYCSGLDVCPDYVSSDTCFTHVCLYGRAEMCTIRHLQSVALLRAEPLKLPTSFRLKEFPASDDLEDLNNYDHLPDEVSVPPQSPAARAAILRYAIEQTKRVLIGAPSGGLTTFTNCPHPSDPNNSEDIADSGARALPSFPGNYAAGLWAEVTVQAYDLLKELSEDTTDAILAAADAQRSLSTTTAQAAGRSFAGKQLSRAEAAHLLIGGSPGLLGETSKAFCSSPELSGRARAALEILRRAAPDPADVAGNAELTSFLDGISARLEVLGGEAITSLPEHTGFSLDDFAQARSYLAQEITTFARDGNVTFVPEAILAIPPGMSFYAATGREPTPPPPHYFAALARQWEGVGPRRPHGGEIEATDVAATLAIAMARIREGIGLADGTAYISGLPTWADVAKNQFQGPLNLLAARDERVGQLGWRKVSSGTNFYIDGYNEDHKLRIVRGLSGLLCATTGQIEGVSCDEETFGDLTVALMDSTAELGSTTLGRGYVQAAAGGADETLDWNDASPIFLVKPKDAMHEVPGTYDVLAGFVLKGLTQSESGSGGIAYRFPIYPDFEKKVGEILRPSTKWCTRAAVECDGTLFDERLL